MKRFLMITILAICICAVAGCALKGGAAGTAHPFAPRPPKPAGTAAQQAWDWAEIAAVAMLSLGAILLALELINGSSIKGAISLLAGGGALLGLALVLQRWQTEIEIAAGILTLAGIALAGWEIWQHRKQIEAQLDQATQPPATPAKAAQ